MASLSSHANVHNTCLRILRFRGYRLWVEGKLDEGGLIEPSSLAWMAERDGFTLHADTPIELLGLAAILDHKRPTQSDPYWWKVDGPDIREELLAKTFGNDAVAEK
jgi:hypothetical protein